MRGRQGYGRRIADQIKHVTVIICAMLAALAAIVAAYKQTFGG